MKKIICIAVLAVGIVLLLMSAAAQTAGAPSEQVRAYVLQELDAACEALELLKSEASVQRYEESRKHYKHIEFFTEYYSKRESKYFINGPLVPKHDPDMGNEVFEPQGFQRIEELLYTAGSIADRKLIAEQCSLLITQFTQLRTYYADVAIEEGNLLELCQLQLFRISSMSFNGYDATISLNGITESAYSMEGVEAVVQSFAEMSNDRTQAGLHKKTVREIARAKTTLLKHPDYNTFNRLDFIVRYVNNINALLTDLHHGLRLPWTDEKRALNLQSRFLFGEESFNMRFFSIYYDDTLHLREQAALGEQLFSDPLLSGNGMKACSDCHQPGKQFTDGLRIGTGVQGQALKRNTPTLAYVAFQQSFFYDGRAYQLEQQVYDVVHNTDEMSGNLEEAVLLLRGNEKYRTLFADAFRNTPDSAITVYAVMKCISEYEKTVALFSSRFDRYLRGDRSALTKREVNGYNLFAGKALCGSCHFFPLFNGTVPPFFSDTEFEVIGTPADSTNTTIDSDEGRFTLTHLDMHHRAFKTPTLRNVSVTAPYMHNGAYNSLTQVIDFYAKGGGGGMGFAISNQTLPFDSLQLSVREKEDIGLFLKTLTDDQPTVR